MKHILLFIIIALSAVFGNIPDADSSQQASAQGPGNAALTHLQLKGTLFTESVNPLAVIENTRSGQILMYELGDSVEGLRVARISRGEIVLKLNSIEYILSFPQGGVYSPRPAGDGDSTWFNITRQGNTITTDRATVTGALLRVRDIMRNLKAGPYAEEGKNAGIAINALKEEGILKEIGIKQGDIIKSVNSLTLNSPYQIFNAYRKLKDKDELKVEITRKGKPLTLTYRVKK
jgi:general secretion pathway protein C